MKNKLLFLIFFILSPFVMHAQVGIGVEDPHPSAALEIVSKEKGLLISRMTLSEKNAIQNPAESLLIYQTDGDIGFYYFDGSFWVYLKNIKQINADWNATSGNAQILNKPAIAKAGTSGDFNDLLNIPALVLAGDTSKMLLPYLTLDKIQPFLDGKASVADLNKEMARAIQLEQQLAANLQAEISRATKADSVSKINMETVEQKFDAQVKVNSDKINANTADINSLNTKVTANTSGIQTNATTIGQKESSANKSTDVTLADGTDTKFPTEKAVKTFVDGKVATLNTASTNMQAELDATELGSGLATDGSYVANTASNYIKTATSLKDATEKLDAQAKINAQNISINTTDISSMDTKVTANTSGIQTNATTIGLKESSANKSTDVTLADGTDTKFPTEKAVKTFVDGKVATLNTASTNMQAELDATELGSGLATDGSYVANTASNYIKTATSLKDATEKLDAQAKINAQNISINTTDISSMDTKVTANTSGIQTNATTIGLKESSANKSTDVTLADGTDTKFPTEKAVKTYVDQAIANRGVGVPYTGATQTLNLGNNDLKTTSNITASRFLVPNATNSQFLKGDGTLDSKQYVEVKTNTVAIGTDAGKLGQQQNAIAIGAEAGSEIQKQNSIAIGAGAGRGLQEVGSIAIGYVAGDGGQGSHSIALGSNVAQGAQAAESVGIGYAAAQYNQGEKSVALGAFAGNNNQSNNAVAIGYNAQTAAPNSVALGSGAVVTASNTIQLGNSAVTAVKTAGKLTTGAITLPNLDGTSGQVLSTNGAGLVSWATPSTATNATFMDLTSAQTVAGDKTFSSNIIVNGVSVGRGNGNNDESLAIGQGAMGVSNTNGKRNTAVGWGAMRSYVGTGFDNNTSLGYNNLPGLTTGSGNTSVGAESMMALTTGTENTSLGNQSLINTKGNDNVGIGKRSGQTISTGSQNTIVGTNADVSVGSLSNATALGNQAVVTASNTIQLGNSAVTAVKTAGKLTTGAITLPNLDGTSGQVLATNGAGLVSWATPSTATNGTFVDLTSAQTVGGVKAFSSDISVNGLKIGRGLNNKTQNTALGFEALNSNTSGIYNTALGYRALKSNTSGVNNTALGFEALNSNTSGVSNTALGSGVLKSNTTGGWNTGIGYEVLTSNTTGGFNTGLGYSALSSNTSGGRNTAIGYNANVSIGSLSNATAIGNEAVVSSSNTIQLGNSAVTAVKTSGKITTGAITLPNTDGVNGQVLTTNGAGVAAWSTPTFSTNATILNTVTIESSALNNYDVSNVTVIFVRPNTSWTDIYGLQGGVLGQVIHIYTVNNQTANPNEGLSLLNFDSGTGNDGIQKFVAPGGIGIDSNENTTLIFDGTYWRVTRTR